MATLKEHPCAICGKPTDLQGWMILGSFKTKQTPVWWCQEHYLVNMFNLWPFTCTPKCQDNVSKKFGVLLEPEDTYVWLNMVTALVPAIKGLSEERPVPMKPTQPMCPHCGKRMKLVVDAVQHAPRPVESQKPVKRRLTRA